MVLAARCGLLLFALLGAEAAADPRQWNELAARSNRHFERGEYGAAESVAREALDVARRSFEPNDRRVVISLKNLATLYRASESFAEAERMIALARSAAEGAKWAAADLAGIEREAVNIHLAQHKWAEAADLLERETALLESHVVRWLPKPPTGRELMGEAHGAAQRLVDRVLDLSAVYLSSGNAARAEASALRAQRFCDSYLREDPIRAAPWVALADVYGATGRFRQEDAFLRAALAWLERRAPNHRSIGSVLTRVAGSAMHHGRLTDAETMLVRALSIREKAGARGADSAPELTSLALLREKQGRHGDAEALHKRVISAIERSLGATHVDIAVPLNNLGRHYRTTGRKAEAAAAYARAIEVARRGYPDGHPLRASLEYSLGSLHLENGELDLAEPLLRRSLDEHLRLQHEANHLAAGPYREVAVLQAARGDIAGARESFLHALRIHRAVLDQYFTFLTEQERLNQLENVDHFLSAFFSFCATHAESLPALAGDMYDAIVWRKGLVGRSVAELQRRVANDAALAARLDRLRALRGRLSALVAAPRKDRSQWQDEVQKLESEARAADRDLVRAVGPLARLREEGALGWAAIRTSLGTGEAAIEFVRFERRELPRRAARGWYAALVLPGQAPTPPRLVDLGPAAAVEEEPYIAFRRSIAPKPNRLAEGAESLYRAVWERVEPALGGARRVVVAPDGVLNLVPFDAIPLPAGERLMDRHEIRLVSNTRQLLRKDEAAASARAATLVGNPLFAMDERQQRAAVARAISGDVRRSAGAWGTRSIEPLLASATPLPGTQLELTSIGALLARAGWSVDVRSGELALEEAVKRVQRPRILHIATHGFFLPDVRRPESDGTATPEDPLLRSGLLLAGASRAIGRDAAASGDLEDGVLTAYEASVLDLQGTELVVLSACETGLGDVRGGEGVFGLRRAFEVAGAEAILMSLWSVPDDETRELMTLFYESWLAGKSKHEALRAAQATLRERIRQRHGADLPFYWGAFVLVGG